MITFDCYNNVRAIHFPPGLPEEGGSCEFTTKKCRRECNYRINSFELEVLSVVKRTHWLDSAVAIRNELMVNNCNILTWFATGDCPKELTEKIFSIMHQLKLDGYIQCGFTRNRQLWEQVILVPEIKLAFSTEDEGLALKLSQRGLVSVPDYDYWTTSIYVKGSKVFNCGGGFGTTCGEGFVIEDAPVEKVYSEDCGHCYDGKRGCFT